MIKNLRYLLLSLLAIMSTATFAQKTVTIDFDNDYQTLFPTLPGVSSGSGDSYVGDGDFKSITMSAPVEGVMVTIAPDEEATNPSRIWTSAPRLRMYSGSFTVVSMLGTPITKIEFTGHDKNFNLTPVEGTLTEKVWTGSSLSPIFMVSKNTQINKIVVTLGEGGGTTPDNPDNEKSIFSKFDFTKGTFTESDTQLVFDFEGLGDSGTENVKIPITGNFTFDFENNLCTTCSASLTFPDELTAVAASIAIKASAEEDGYTDIQLDGTTVSLKSTKEFIGVSKIVIKSMLKMLLDDEQGGYGLLTSPLSPNQANIFAGTLEKDKVYEEDIYIKGKIASIKYEFSAQYGTATFFISADGKDDFTFQCYSVYYLENKPWVEGNTQIKVGDEVIICGKVTNFKGTTPETASKQAYIYSLNGVTKNEGGSETPDPQVTTATCAEVLAGTDGTVYRVTGKCVEIANTTYGNWYLEDATGKIYIYGTLDKEGNAGKNNSIDVWGIEVGDELTVEGERTTYKETVELKNVKVIDIKKAAAEGGAIYSWEGGAEGAAEAGGKATYENGETDETKYRVNYKNGDYYTICVNGKKANINDAGGSANSGYILITLDQELQAGDNIELTGYINKNESKEASIYFLFEKGEGVNDDYIFGDASNIDPAIGGKVTTHAFQVPESAAGSKSFKMSRNKAGTNIFLTKLAISRGTTGIKEIKTVQPQNNAIYNLAGQRVDANYKGVVIKNGQKMIQK